MKAYPFLINADSSGNGLLPLDEHARLYDEGWLQELLRTHPDILPAGEIELVFHPLIPIGREVPVGNGAIDNLFISPRGYLVLVETKLWRNPEAKREVVAQAIDYGSSIANWSYRKLDDVVRTYTKKFENKEYGLVEWVEHQHGPIEAGRDFFEKTVAKNLRLGRFLTLIVGDKIRQSIVEMLGYINKYPHLASDFALVQLSCYRWQTETQWPLLVVPNIIARTEIIERSVIEVTVNQDGGYHVDVRQEGGQKDKDDKKPQRATLTEEAFWELLMNQAPERHNVARQLIDDYRERDGIRVEPGESSLVVKLDIQDTGQQASLFFLDKNADLRVWPNTLGNQLTRAGLNRTLAESYDTEMKRIMNLPKKRTDLSRQIAAVNIQEFKLEVDALIERIQTADQSE